MLHFREFCLFDCLCLPWCCLTFVPIFGLSVFATVGSTAVGTLCLFQASVFQFLAFRPLPLTARISFRVGSICDYFSHILCVCVLRLCNVAFHLASKGLYPIFILSNCSFQAMMLADDFVEKKGLHSISSSKKLPPNALQDARL